MATVFANGRSVIHKGDGHQHVAAPPDVCKTPSPGGPVPVPYPNMAASRDLAEGTKGVKIEGKPAANAGSKLSKSSGNEAGTAGGGLVSAKTMGKLSWGSSSPNVKIEGKGAVRFLDVTQQNGNSYNTAFTTMGGTGLAYADDFQGECPICRKGPAVHRVLEMKEGSGALCQRLLQALRDEFKKPGAVTGKERKKWRSGFMVGVMVCKHDPPQSFATTSGKTPATFTKVASTIVDHVLGGGPATIEDFVAANQSEVSRSRVAEKIEKAFKEIEVTRNDRSEWKTTNKTGHCAGAKLMARVGHAPLSMTEMFFRADAERKAPWSATYSVISNKTTPTDAWLRAVLDNAMSVPQPRTYDTNASIASCHTCQRTLHLTMCPERNCG